MLLDVHPQLAQAALREHHDRFYRVWCVLRALDEDGSGHIPLKVARASVCKALDIKPKTFKRILHDGKRVWWVVGQRAGMVHRRSLDSVCAALELDYRPGAPVLVEVEQVRSLKVWRGFCLAAQFANPKMIDKPVSMETLAKRIRRSRRTVLDYVHRCAGLKVQRNRLVSKRNITTLDLDAQRQGWHHTLDGGQPITVRHLPNSYQLDAPIGATGRARKVRTSRGRTRVHGRGSTTAQVVFVAAFQQAQRARRAISSTPEGGTTYVTERPIPEPRGASWRQSWRAPWRQWDGYTKECGELRSL